jgi:hypothetical protein
MTFALALIAALAPAQDDGFQSLFDGRTLRGWAPRGGGRWSVEDGTILGETGTGAYGWLVSEKRYGDFVLELEAKHEGTGNSGVQVRSAIDDKDLMVGYQFDLDRTRPSSGRLYDEARRKLLQDVPEDPKCRAAFKADEWNRLRIECVADRLRSWVNDVPIVDTSDPVDVQGVLALQVHSGKDVRVRFRNLRIKDLGRRAWKPIWDGKSLAGWHAIGKGEWTIADGALAARHPKSEPQFGHLVTDAVFKDFTVRLKYKASKGNSGLYFRIEEKGFSGVSGFQAEIDPERDAGGLYETNGRAWVVKPRAEDVAKWYRANEWNEMTVSARGTRVVVHVNGWKTAELPDDAKGRLEGRLALQVHGGQDVEVLFKDIEILGAPE